MSLKETDKYLLKSFVSKMKKIQLSLGSKTNTMVLDFLEKTSIHGLISIRQSENLFHKIIWIILVFIAFSFCLYMVITSCINYSKFETITIIREINELQSLFPTVVLCNRNTFTNRYSYEYLKNYSYLNNRSDLFENPSLDLIQSNSFLFRAFSSYIKQNRNVRLLDYNISEILLSCKFNQQECNQNDFVWFNHIIYGNCYKFNPDINSKTTYWPGRNQGLRLELFVGIYDKLEKLVNNKGLSVIIINSTKLLGSIEDGIFVTPGTDSNIELKRFFKERLPKPYSNCDIKDIKIDSFSSFLYKLLYEKTGLYHYDDCLELCYQKNVVDFCGCYDYESLAYFDVEICSSDDQIRCLQSIYRNMSSSTRLSKSCYEQCPLECDLSDFSTTLSTAPYPPTDYYLNLLRNNNILKTKFSDISTISDEKIRSSVLRLNIYYSSLSYQLIIESPSQTVVGLLANLGGTLGLFLGMSFISITEVFEIFILLTINLIRTNVKKNKIRDVPSV